MVHPSSLLSSGPRAGLNLSVPSDSQGGLMQAIIDQQHYDRMGGGDCWA